MRRCKGAMKIGKTILKGHLNHCVRGGIAHGDADKTIAEFAKAAAFSQDGMTMYTETAMTVIAVFSILS